VASVVVSIVTGSPARAVAAAAGDTVAAGRYILVDQFGYRPGDAKVAVLVDPLAGFNAADSFVPGRAYEVRRWADGAVVLRGEPVAWENGRTEPSSGDRGWWFDFTALDVPGRYFVYDVERRQRSPAFAIGGDVYAPVLRAAVRAFFYARSGFPKRTPFAERCWEDAAAIVGPGQDGEARLVTRRGDASTVRDLHGGWFDAGDTNKYVTFAYEAVQRLLAACRERPEAFSDDTGIPESGNGVPDLLDELRWETDWLARMQDPEGGLALKVGAITARGEASPPSADRRPRYYVGTCSSSTIAGAAAFAHAAVVFRGVPELRSAALDLERRARSAWRHFAVHPRQEDCDTGKVQGGDADWPAERQERTAVVAAVYLFALTGESAYADAVRAGYRRTRPFSRDGWDPYELDQGEALLFYASLPTADPAVAHDIRARKVAQAAARPEIYGFHPEMSLYRAFMIDRTWHWGSNQPRANTGNANLELLFHGLDPAHAASYRERALGLLHYFHGVNPLGMVYLTNMYGLGAASSANRVYHQWFAPGTVWDDARRSPCGPAPGFVPGGPSAEYTGHLSPPAGQPRQKAYRDWNGRWPENSWEITEPGIYYQAAYVKLLSGLR
jgi:endoglucanase